MLTNTFGGAWTALNNRFDVHARLTGEQVLKAGSAEAAAISCKICGGDHRRAGQ